MELTEGIVVAINEFCTTRNLNANGICKRGSLVEWESTITNIGKIKFQIPFSRFEESMEKGMSDVSVLIAFADLVSKPENKGMGDNMVDVVKRGLKRLYFSLSATRKNVLYTYKYDPRVFGSVVTIPIEYEENDGEYSWEIPNNVEFLESYENNEVEVTPSDILDIIGHDPPSAYIGMSTPLSQGLPINRVVNTVEKYIQDSPNKNE